MGGSNLTTMEGHSIQRYLWRRYAFALSLLALLSISTFLLLSIALSAERARAEQINIAGKQRMLSQRIALMGNAAAVALDEKERAAAIDKMETALIDFENAHWSLTTGLLPSGQRGALTANTVDIYFGALDLDGLVRQYTQIGHEFVMDRRAGSPVKPEELASLNELAFSTLLQALDRATNNFEAEGKAAIERIEKMELAVVSFALLLIFLEVLFIFKPVTAFINNIVSALSASEQQQTRLAERRRRFVGHLTPELYAKLASAEKACMSVRAVNASKTAAVDLDRIDAALQDLDQLINTMVDYVGTDKNQQNLKANDCRLDHLLENAQRHCRLTAIERAVTIRQENRTNSLWCVHNATALGPTLRYLTERAIGSIGPKGTICLEMAEASPAPSASKKGDKKERVQVSIICQSPDKRNESRNPFDFLSRSTNAKFKESIFGIDLREARQLAARAKAHIDVKTDIHGETHFILTLEAERMQSAHKTERSPHTDLSCLLVEDENNEQQRLTKMLEGLGHTVHVVENGAAALQAVKRDEFSLILTKTILPDLVGKKLTSAIRKTTPVATPIIGISKHGPDSVRAAASLECFDFILGPSFNKEQLQEALELVGISDHRQTQPDYLAAQ